MDFNEGKVIPIDINEEMQRCYIDYSMSVIVGRALPDVRDGLKPVHRRILYSLHELGIFPDKGYRKCARIVGDVLGKYHPHGDSSVYDALVRMAQDFSMRYMLVDGHGNFGSVDGDSPAAMRYTEAKMNKIAVEMLRDINKDTVEFGPNFDGEEKEPMVLPSRFPNLLVNGSSGIAVGMATNIPPHNLGEVTDGVLAYIDNPEITTKELMNYIKGPDLPTGGVLIGKNSMISAYETGEGKVTCRAKTSIEKLENGRLGIVITEFPYRRNKAKLLQTISEMTGDKRHQKALEAITDIRDESDRTGIRAVIEFKKSVDKEGADKVLKYLYKKTDLQCNISFNMVALANGKPETMGLKTIIKHYVNHQKDIVTRRTIKELELAEKRFHIVEGFIKAINILDEVIKTIRNSKSKKDAGVNLVKNFDFTEEQANAILELMLYRLTGLEINVFQKEYKELERKIKKYKKILSDEKELLKVVKSELKEITDKYRTERKTEIIEDESEGKIHLDELIVVEDVMITLSRDGFIKRVPYKNYSRYNFNPDEIEYREGDELKYLIKSNTKESLLIFTNKGNMYQVKGINIPEYKWKEKGERIDIIIKSLNLDEEKIVGSLSVDEFSKDKYIQIITNRGTIKKSSLDKFITNYSKLQASKLRANEEVVKVEIQNDENKFLKVKTELGLDFTVEIPNSLEDTPRNLLGYELFNLSSKDKVVSIEYTDDFNINEFGVGVTSKGMLKYFSKVSKNDKLKINTNSKDELLMFTNKGNIIKISAFMLEEAIKNELQITNLVDNFAKGEKIISLYSIKEFDERYAVYTFTKKGIVRKANLKEFEGKYVMQQGYKFKTEDDEVINVDIAGENIGHIIMITKKGMAIRFPVSSVSSMGRISSGVTGISLKDEDEVIFGKCVLSIGHEDEVHNKIQLTSKNKEVKNILLDDIKLQNRAGRGSCVMIIVLDDEIKNVTL